MRHVRSGIGVLAALALSGCYNWRAAVIHTAGFEHHCPETSVRILGDNGDAMARSVQLNVCGEERTYRDVGGARAYVWVDYTRPLGSTATDPSRASTSSARTTDASSQPWSDADARSFVRQANDAVVACMDGESVSMRFTIDAQGHGTGVTGLDPAPSVEQRTCVVAALASARVEGTSHARRISARFTATSAAADIEPIEDDATTDAAATTFPDVVRARIGAAAGPILACVGAPSAAIQAEWQASGQVTFSVRGGSTDSLVDDCVRAALGGLDVPPGTTAGRLLHPVSG